MGAPVVQPECWGQVGECAAGAGGSSSVGGSLVVTARKVSVLRAVRAELEKLGKADTAVGMMALSLAARLDAGGDPGSATAAMAKELRSTMEQLGRSGSAVGDPLDELKRRREQRLSG